MYTCYILHTHLNAREMLVTDTYFFYYYYYLNVLSIVLNMYNMDLIIIWRYRYCRIIPSLTVYSFSSEIVFFFSISKIIVSNKHLVSKIIFVTIHRVFIIVSRTAFKLIDRERKFFYAIIIQIYNRCWWEFQPVV